MGWKTAEESEADEKVDTCEMKMDGKSRKRREGGKESGGWKKKVQCMFTSMSFPKKEIITNSKV